MVHVVLHASGNPEQLFVLLKLIWYAKYDVIFGFLVEFSIRNDVKNVIFQILIKLEFCRLNVTLCSERVITFFVRQTKLLNASLGAAAL